MYQRRDGSQTQTTSPLVAHGGGVAVALVFAVLWIVLTIRTGTTYHLFPLAIAALPAIATDRVFDANYRSWLLAPTGLLIVALATGVLELLSEMPTATFIHDQPGGVVAEFAILAVVGAGLGLWIARPKT